MLRRLVLILMLLASPALAVNPDEILDDPALEARARAITAELRCVVCRNESVDFSNAEIARDIRLIVRERLVAGDSDDEVVQFMVDRFGEYVLLAPRATGANLILWLAAPALLLTGLGLGMVVLRRRSPQVAPLNPEEEARLRAILEKE